MDASQVNFKGLNEAEVYDRGGNYITPGTYDLRLEQVIAKRTQSKGDALIFEFVVLNSYGSATFKPGDKVTYFQKLLDAKIALPNLKSFLIAALGLDYTKQKELVEREVSPKLEGILREAIDLKDDKGKTTTGLNGCKVHCVAMNRTAEKTGNTYTVYKWSAMKEVQ